MEGSEDCDEILYLSSHSIFHLLAPTCRVLPFFHVYLSLLVVISVSTSEQL